MITQSPPELAVHYKLGNPVYQTWQGSEVYSLTQYIWGRFSVILNTLLLSSHPHECVYTMLITHTTEKCTLFYTKYPV